MTFNDDVKLVFQEKTLRQEYINPVHQVAKATNYVRWRLTFVGPWYGTSPFYTSGALNFEVALRFRKMFVLLLRVSFRIGCYPFLSYPLRFILLGFNQSLVHCTERIQVQMHPSVTQRTSNTDLSLEKTLGSL